jgi:Flp pilus assembly pilin Flp
MTFSLHHIHLSSLRRASRDERGVALVEFALALPVLALLLFGVLDFGRAFNYWIDTTHLASEGARYAAVDQNPAPLGSAPNFLEPVRDQADTPELRSGGTASVPNALQVCVSFPNGTHNVGDPVKVEVKTTYKFMSLFGGVSKDVVADSTMRLERVPTTYANNECA